VALPVFGDLRVRVSRSIADNRRDFGQRRKLRRAPALRAEVNAVPTLLVSRMNNYWTASISMAGRTTFILAGWTGMNVAG
jgi:hypothetical protein